jgi:hypothetical protein
VKLILFLTSIPVPLLLVGEFASKEYAGENRFSSFTLLVFNLMSDRNMKLACKARIAATFLT